MTVESTEQGEISTENLSRAARKKLKKQAKLKEQQEKEDRIDTKAKKKKIIGWSIASVIGIAVIGFIIFFFSTLESTGPYSGGQVHWHSRITVFVCGDRYTMPAPPSNVHLGKPLLHTHDDKLIHVEGTVYKPGEITLNAYMDAIGLVFEDNQLLKKTNGDLCDGKPGKVKLFVNGEENQELAAYVIKDDEDYELKFE